MQRAGEEQYRGDMAKSRTILEHTQRAIHDVRAQAPAKQSKAFERVEQVLRTQIAETEAAAARAKEEAKRRPAGPLRAAQVAAVADEDAAQSVQKAKLSRKKLFKSDSD